MLPKDPKTATARFDATVAILLLLLATAFGTRPAAQEIQSFSSGSTGADGPLDYSGRPPGTIVVFDPTTLNPPRPAGTNVFNFTTISIPTGVTVKLRGDVINAPVYWLATGAVTINGTIDLDAQDGSGPVMILGARRRTIPGSGGYSGGVGGKFESSAPTQPVAKPGDGPGGGGLNLPAGTCQFNGGGGSFTGNVFLVPLVGGSGGGGGNIQASVGALGSTAYGSGGGAGGGAILIASSDSIMINGVVTANGGKGGPAVGFCNWSADQPASSGGGGSGGAIRVAAPIVVGNGVLRALGGSSPRGVGGNGAIRIEAFTNNFVGSIVAPYTLGSPFNSFVPSAGAPSIAVVSVNGVAVTQPPTGSLVTPDVTINTSAQVTLVIQATNIPVGTVLTLQLLSDNNTDQTVPTTPLVGTLASSTASATVTFPSGYSLNYVKARWTP